MYFFLCCLNIDEEDMDEETKYHLQQVFSAKETEEERLIRLGEMTPFGTTMAKQSTEKKVRKIVIPENELTDFDKFLLGEAEAKAKMKEQKTPQKHPLPSTSKTPPKIIISVPMSEEGATLKTLTDLKAVPRTKYKPKVKLGSKYAKGYIKKKNPKRALITNYKSDSDVSDYDPNEDKMSGSDDEYFPDQDLSDGWEDVSVKKRGKLFIFSLFEILLNCNIVISELTFSVTIILILNTGLKYDKCHLNK